LARADIKQNVDNVNSIIDMFNIDSPTADQILKYNTGNGRFELGTESSSGNITFVGDDSTGTAVSLNETFKIAGGTGITTAVSGDTLTVTASALQDIVDDTTPQLGGNLDLNSQTINGTGTISITGDIGTDAITLADNKITATRSNDNLFISANGTGAIHIAGDDSNIFDSTLYSNTSGTPNRGNTIIATVESVDANSVADRSYNSIIAHNTTLTGSGTDSDFRARAIHANSNIDLAGFDYTNTSASRGPVAIAAYGQAENSGAGASTLATLRGLDAASYIQDYTSNNQDITVNNAYGVRVNNGIENNGTGALTFTNAYGYYASAYTDNQSSGSASITNHYAFYTPGTGGTNNYAFYSASDTAESRLGTIERYRESINSLTSSSTITVDCGLAPFHTVTLGTNTEFNIANLGTGQTVTIKIKQDATGSRTATFGTDGSTAVKFAGGTPTLTTDASAIDVVTIFNDGTDYIGSIAKAFAA
jgi:hypothetical protein